MNEKYDEISLLPIHLSAEFPPDFFPICVSFCRKDKIFLFQGLPKSDKMELIIQKAVELGVYKIVPVEMNRCVVKLDDKKKNQKTPENEIRKAIKLKKEYYEQK